MAEGVDQMMEISVDEFMSDAMDMKKRILAGVALPIINSATNQVVTYKVRVIIISIKLVCFDFLLNPLDHAPSPKHARLR